MNLSTTLYTLAALGFFALMVNRPPVEIPSTSEATKPVARVEASEPALTEPATPNTSTATATTTANEPPQDSGNNATSQPTSTTPTN